MENNPVKRGIAGPGRPKGSQNKANRLLKDAILKAADKAGGKGGMVAYLERQALENPGPFLALLGKVLPLQLTGEDGGPIQTEEVSPRERIASRITGVATRIGAGQDNCEPDGS